MKIFIALALVSMALATPVVQPITLPEAPLPAMEAMPYVAMPEPIDIRPLFVPAEVMEAIKLLEIPSDILADAVHVVDNVEYDFETLNAVDLTEELAAPSVEEIIADAVKFVDVAENRDVAPVAASEVAEEFDASSVSVIIVDNYEVVEEPVAPSADEIPADAVKFVDVAENLEVAPEAASEVAEEIPADAVNFVDVAENLEVASEVAEEPVAPSAEEIPADAVKFVDVAENLEADNEVPVQEAVRVVDMPLRYPGKVYDNPMLR